MSIGIHGGAGGDATAANQTAGNTSLDNMEASLSVLTSVLVQAEGAPANGFVTATAGIDNAGNSRQLKTDTSGELQVDIVSLPNEGQQTMANSISVAIASNQSTLPVKELRSSASAVTSVADSASNVTLLASNANRLGATIYNDSTVALYVKLGATASTTSFTIKMAADAYYEVPFGYTGIIDGIWASDASGSARITELT